MKLNMEWEKEWRLHCANFISTCRLYWKSKFEFLAFTSTLHTTTENRQLETKLFSQQSFSKISTLTLFYWKWIFDLNCSRNSRLLTPCSHFLNRLRPILATAHGQHHSCPNTSAIFDWLILSFVCKYAANKTSCILCL